MAQLQNIYFEIVNHKNKVAISEIFWHHCGENSMADDGQARSLNSAENAKINANRMNRTCAAFNTYIPNQKSLKSAFCSLTPFHFNKLLINKLIKY